MDAEPKAIYDCLFPSGPFVADVGWTLKIGEQEIPVEPGTMVFGARLYDDGTWQIIDYAQKAERP